MFQVGESIQWQDLDGETFPAVVTEIRGDRIVSVEKNGGSKRTFHRWADGEWRCGCMRLVKKTS